MLKLLICSILGQRAHSCGLHIFQLDEKKKNEDYLCRNLGRKYLPKTKRCCNRVKTTVVHLLVSSARHDQYLPIEV